MIAVHHFVANATTRQYGPNPTSDLLGVDYRYIYPPDTEFPRVIPRVDLFVRFYLVNASPTDFLIRVWWLDAPGGVSQREAQYGPFRIDFGPNDASRDWVFRLNALTIRGVGRHAIKLLRQRQRGWRAGQWASSVKHTL